MLAYKGTRTQLNNRFAFWHAFKDDERFFMYNPQTKVSVMGAVRLSAVSDVSLGRGAPYVFSTMSFAETVRDEKWQDFGNENVIFKHYFVEKDGEQTVFQLADEKQHGETADILLEDAAPVHVKHIYKECSGDYVEWQKAFEEIKQEIDSGTVRKVVLSREVELECDVPVQTESMLQNLMNMNPESFVFAYSKDCRTFLGASPEILVQKKCGEILSHALAGTLPRQNEGVQRDLLLHDKKNREEHQIVVDEITNVFKEHKASYKTGETDIVTLKNMHHLLTPIYARDARCVSEWAKHLHPTPAMGGYPVQAAKNLIEKHERHDRGLYAAPIGLIDENGEGVFIAGIRSALVIGSKVYAYAGCGIVKESACLDEYMETACKLRTIVESL